jgi:hypothetical protein
MKAEFRMGVDNIQIEGPHYINNLFFDKKTNPVLGLGGKLEGSDPKNIFLRRRLGMLDGKDIGPVAPFFQFIFQCPYHGHHPVYLGGITITKNANIHLISRRTVFYTESSKLYIPQCRYALSRICPRGQPLHGQILSINVRKKKVKGAALKNHPREFNITGIYLYNNMGAFPFFAPPAQRTLRAGNRAFRGSAYAPFFALRAKNA